MTNDQTVTQALEPCPFCGSDGPLAGRTLDDGWYVMCQNRDCLGMLGYTPTRDKAITAWNTRIAHSGEGRSNGAGDGGPLLVDQAWLDRRQSEADACSEAGPPARQTVMPGDPPHLGQTTLQWYLNYEFGWPHSLRESNIAVEAFKDGYRAALSAPQGQVEREADAFLVEWIRDGETWVEAHADEVRAADQARKHGVEYVPLYRAALAQPEAGGE